MMEVKPINVKPIADESDQIKKMRGKLDKQLSKCEVTEEKLKKIKESIAQGLHRWDRLPVKNAIFDKASVGPSKKIIEIIERVKKEQGLA